jgi:SAM-dependent methyltransferase
MQENAYAGMLAMQENHWWWKGMRRVYQYALSQFKPNPSRKARLIDIGCGFGANLRVLEPLGDVVGVDVSLEALQSIQKRPVLGLVQAEADALPFRADAFDVIALLAVIEHIDHDDTVLAETHRIARQGALQILCTSAFMFLWSHHDVANNHRRRYRIGQIDRLQRAAGWHGLTSYLNAAIFPAVALVRVFQRRDLPSGNSQYDMGPNLGPFNDVMAWILGGEGWLISRLHAVLPFGVDVFSITRRE